mmetsp:Transcript_172769/g.548579  ORF Transcript_172769/g.548579 Transcript_172769/m.548579 type:complete len:146 (-) Transcript_172769:141-578(-)
MFARSSMIPALRAAARPTFGASPAVLAARGFATQVTFVKKIYADGSTCQKCDFVWKQIVKDKLVEKIDRIVVADERDMKSEGIILATRHKVTRAPFFVVNEEGASEDQEKVYDVYFKLKKEVFAQETGENEKNEEIIRGIMKQVF